MSVEQFIHNTVEDFLIEQRNSLCQDRQLLEALLKKLLPEQQISLEDDVDKKYLDEANLNAAGESRSSSVNAECIGETITSLASPNSSTHLRKSKEYNSQIEKERLATLFENAPYAFNFNVRKKREFRSSFKHQKNPEELNGSEDKENILTDEVTDVDISLKKISRRPGEFSPFNPAFRSDSNFLELGEFEQRRKIYLEKIKTEQVQDLKNYVNKKILINLQNSSTPVRQSISNQRIKLFDEDSIPTYLNSPTKERMENVKKYKQNAYRKELDEQIKEKRRAIEAEKEREKKNCEFWIRQEMIERENLMQDIENKFCKNLLNDKLQDEGRICEVRNTNRYNNQHDSIPMKSPSDKKVSLPSYLRSPILKPTVETCKVNDFEAYQRMQKELYKKDLTKQIEEKQNIERKRKLEEIEFERKIEENVFREEEKLRLQYEREQAERDYRVAQKAQIEKTLQENLCRIRKENNDRKKVVKISVSNPRRVYPTNHQVKEKSKTIIFAPRALMHCISNENTNEENISCMIPSKTEKACKMDSLIVEAPYTLAIKDGHCSDPCGSKSLIKSRSPSPVLPAVRTRNLINALPKNDDFEIPAGVSMSKPTKIQFMKDKRILSNLSEIRRKLLEDQSKTCCNQN